MRGFGSWRTVALGLVLCAPMMARSIEQNGAREQPEQTGAILPQEGVLQGGVPQGGGGNVIATAALELLHLITGKPAAAQVIWDAPNVIIQKPKPGAPDVKSRPEVWPRLDRGAVLCRTEADLLRLAASRRGQTVAAPNCQIIRAPTPIQIVSRAGPGRTRVTVTEQNAQEGWTDAWLPDKAPPSTAKGTTIR